MIRGLEQRLARLEEQRPEVPRHEENMAAMARLEAPPPGYTEADRQRDEDISDRWAASARAAGLLE